ncbi:MAG: COX15/CtaA family protein [Pirellulales bacterium]
MTSIHETFSQRMLRLSAWALCCATLPLIFVGGLVTTTDAGMAVPDWPNTYGYNMFLYPLDWWWAGGWDLFVEHGHRLLGAAVGILAIAVVMLAWKIDDRRWFRWLTVGVLVAICSQGLLGGMRVRLDARMFAMLHGCTAPLVFALTLIQADGARKRTQEGRDGSYAMSRIAANLGVILFAAVFVQLILGAQLRHAPRYGGDWLSFREFRFLTIFHVLGALVVTLLIAAFSFVVLRRKSHASRLRGPAVVLSFCVLGQVLLGIGSWIVRYGWPWGDENLPELLRGVLPEHVVTARGFTQTLIPTAHVAFGAIILAVSALVVARTAFVVRSATLPIANPSLSNARAVV